MYRSPGTCSAGGSTASILPRSTSTVRGSLPCWITPATMSPSCPAYSPKVISSSTSRSRCRITWRAVVAAIRPNPAGVSSYSRCAAPSGPDSRAQTVTWPVFRFTSTRAAGLDPSIFWYAISSASSIALMAVSCEISFSLSRLRSTLRSMSIAASSKLVVGRLVIVGEPIKLVGREVGVVVPIRQVALVRVRQRPELDLNPPWAERRVLKVPPGASHVQRHAVIVRGEDPALHGALARHLDLHQPPGGAPPVPRLGQRPVHARRGDLEGVGDVAHRIRRVEQGGDLPADLGGVVEAHPAVRVNHDPQQPPLAGYGYPG